MKAKIIKTGEVVEVHQTTTGWASDNLNTTRFFNESELDFDYREWEVFRREAAKDILCAFNCAPGPYMKSLQEAVHDAIKQADELIKQLRDGQVHQTTEE